MYEARTVFPQLLDHLPRHVFRRVVNRCRGDHRVRRFSCRDQFLAMVFAQFTVARACATSRPGWLEILSVTLLETTEPLQELSGPGRVAEENPLS